MVALYVEVAEIERALMMNDGVLTPELEEKFNLATGDLAKKADAYRVVCDGLEAKADHWNNMAKQMLVVRKVLESQVERLRGNLKYVMASMTTTELEGHNWIWKLSRGRPKLVIDESKLSSIYFKTVETKVIDKERIEGDLALGLSVDGAHYEETAVLKSYANKSSLARPVTERIEDVQRED